MSVFFRYLVFVSLIVSLLTMAAIRVGHYWQPFAYNTDIQQAPKVDLDIELNKLEERQRFLEAKETELISLQNEINEKIQVLQKAEQNILRLLQQNKELAASLQHHPEEEPSPEMHNEEENEIIDEEKTTIIEEKNEDTEEQSPEIVDEPAIDNGDETVIIELNTEDE